MATLLRNLKLNRCDLVDEPANPKAHVVLYKSATKKADARPKGEARHASKEQLMKKSFLKSLTELFKAAEAEAGPLAEWARQEEMEPEHPMKALYDKMCKAMEGMELPEEHPLKMFAKELSDMVTAAAPLGPITKSKEEPVEKAEPVSKREVELAKRLEDVEKALKAEKDAAALTVTKGTLLKFKSISVDPEKDAPVFKKLAETDQVAYDRVLELLNGAETVLAKSQQLEKDLGSPQGGDGTKGTQDEAWAAIEAEADKLIQKDGKLTKEQAINQVMESRRDLVKRHLA